MRSASIGNEEIYELLQSYKEDTTPTEATRIRHLEGVIDRIVGDYENHIGTTSSRSGDSSWQREMDYDFLDSVRPEIQDNEGLSPVEVRIKRSDLLTLHYALVGGGISNMMNRFIEGLSSEEREELEQDTDGFLKVASAIVEKFVVSQREKNKENELISKFPEAPTTGFEFEYTDPLRDLLDEMTREPRRELLLEALLKEDREAIKKLLMDARDEHFLASYYETVLKIREESNDLDAKSFLMAAILTSKKKQATLRKITTLAQAVSAGDNEPGIRSAFQAEARDTLIKTFEEVKLFMEALGQNDYSEHLERIFRGQLELVLGRLELAEGTPLTYADINAIRLLVPSPAKRISQTGAFKVIDEMSTAEEAITEPSVSVRMQLRDFVYATKMGAFSNRLVVHQTLGGVELSPERTDFMEVTAILEAANYNTKDKVIPEDALREIENGKNVYADPFKKTSTLADGKTYYFPYHKVRNQDHAVNYPRGSRSLVELRALRAFDPSTSFITHVRASTFTWLAAWGEQAANIELDNRNGEQKQLADAWEELMMGWQKILQRKGIYQPRGSERYQQVEKDNYKVNFIGEEKYSLYLDQISARSMRESQNGNADQSDSIRSESRRLIREYSAKVKKIIGY